MTDSLTSSLENSRRSSRSPSPARGGSPKPYLKMQPMAAYDKKSKYPTWLRVLTSGWFYYTSLIFTLLLLLTVSHYYISVDYCSGKEYIDCKPCPPNYKCNKTTKTCDGLDHNGICIPYNSSDHLYDLYNETKDLLEDLVTNGKVKTIDEIRRKVPSIFANQTSRNIVSLVSIIDGYTVKNGRIVKDTSESFRFSIVLSAYIISLICFLVSVYLRNKPPQF